MNPILVKLKSAGCNVDVAIERFVDDEDLLIECIGQVLDDDNFNKLHLAVERKDAEVAFEAAHTLKGIIANTELNPMNGYIVKILEPLRNGEFTGVEENLKALERSRQELKSVIK